MSKISQTETMVFDVVDILHILYLLDMTNNINLGTLSID